MDLPAIPIMQTTSTEKLSIYMDQYSEFMDDLVTLYNYHKAFLDHKGRVTTARLRGQYKKVSKSLNVMNITCWKAFLEENANRKLRKKFQVETNKYNKAYRKLNPAKMGRPKKVKDQQEIQYGIRISKHYKLKGKKNG
jgi:hypothetical protein